MTGTEEQFADEQLSVLSAEATLYAFADDRIVVDAAAGDVSVDGEAIKRLQPAQVRRVKLSCAAGRREYTSRSDLGGAIYPNEPNAKAREQRVQVHVSKIREGLGPVGAAALVFVIGHGYSALQSLEGIEINYPQQS